MLVAVRLFYIAIRVESQTMDIVNKCYRLFLQVYLYTRMVCYHCFRLTYVLNGCYRDLPLSNKDVFVYGIFLLLQNNSALSCFLSFIT